MHLDKEAAGLRWVGLKRQVNAWDPLGLIADGAPDDEYDCILGLIMRALESGETPDAIAKRLETEFAEHFGDPGGVHGSLGFAAQVRVWFDANWKGTTV